MFITDTPITDTPITDAPVTDTTTPAPDRAGLLADPAAVLELADRARAAAVELRPAVTNTGLQRRQLKLSRQLAAAGQLLARGARSTRLVGDPPLRRCDLLLRRCARLPREGAELWVQVADTDAVVAAATGVLVELHRWRGHLGSLPDGT